MSSNRPSPIRDEHVDAGQKVDSDEATVSLTYVPVYTFYVYDHDQGTPVLYPRMATRQAIMNMRGKFNEDTAMVVDEALLDREGFLTS